MRALLGTAVAALILGIAISAPIFWWAGHGAPAAQGTADEVALTLQGMLHAADGPCAILFAPDSGDLILPIFIQPFEAAALLEEIRAPNDRQRPTTDRLALALIEGLGGRLEKMRIETPEPLKSRGSLFVRGPAGELVLPAPGSLVISLAFFTAVPLTIDRRGLEAWGMSQRDFESLLASLHGGDGADARPRDAPTSVDL